LIEKETSAASAQTCQPDETNAGINSNVVPVSVMQTSDSTYRIYNSSKSQKYARDVIFIVAAEAAIIPLCLYWNKVWDFLDRHNGAVSSIATLAIMLLTAAYVVISGRQWEAMNGQLEQMKHQVNEMQTAREQTIAQMTNSGIQTDELIEHASNQAEALLNVAEFSLTHARAATITAEATTKAAEAAQANVKAMERSQRLAERAWLSPDIIEATLDSNGLFKVWVKTINTGRTPAIKANLGMNITPSNSDTIPIFTFPDPTGFSTVIFPNSDWRNFIDGTFSDIALRKVHNGEIIVWINGKVIYEDIFGRAHWVKFCYRMRMPDRVCLAHSEHNEIDNNND
jgi:hypothetical protein